MDEKLAAKIKELEKINSNASLTRENLTKLSSNVKLYSNRLRKPWFNSKEKQKIRQETINKYERSLIEQIRRNKMPGLNITREKRAIEIISNEDAEFKKYRDNYLKEKFCTRNSEDLNYYITGPIGPYPIPPKEPYSPSASGSDGAAMYKQMYESNSTYTAEKAAYEIAKKIYETASKKWYENEEKELNNSGEISDKIRKERDRRINCVREKNEIMAKKLQNKEIAEAHSRADQARVDQARADQARADQARAAQARAAQARAAQTPPMSASPQGYPGHQGYQVYPGHQGYQGYPQGYSQGYPQVPPGYPGYQGYQGHQGYQGYPQGYPQQVHPQVHPQVYRGYQGYPQVYPNQGHKGTWVRKSRRSRTRRSRTRRSRSRKPKDYR